MDAVFRYRRDPEFQRYHRHPPNPFAQRDAELFVSEVMARPWEENPWFAIVIDGVLVGNVDLVLDSTHHAGEVGYDVARDRWGQGIATEAARAMVDYGFSEFRLNLLWAEADERNIASWSVMEKLGMRRDGVLRARYLLAGRPSDWVQYSLLRGEWEERRG